MSCILIADDQEDLRHLMAISVEIDGYDILTASSGTEAQEILSTRHVDLAMLDVNMPGMTGLALTKWLREQSGFDHVAVLLVSAMANPDDIRRGLEVGADHYLTKPFDIEELRSVVAQLIAAYRPSDPERG